MSPEQSKALEAYDSEHIGMSKGALSFVVVITRMLQEQTFPVSADMYKTAQEGQVRGLGGSAIKRVLKDHGIDRVLSSEGGRTSRGSMGKLYPYVDVLNDLHGSGHLDLLEAERFWVEKVQQYFDQLPFVFRLDPSKSLRACVRQLLEQAVARQREVTGTMYAGAVMQHLIGAKLDIITDGQVDHHGVSVADAPTNRAGDFLLGDTAIHVTTAPSAGLMEKINANLQAGLKPIIVTTVDGLGGANAIAKQYALEDRIDVIEVEQFVAGNLYEWSKFEQQERDSQVKELFDRYNRIVADVEQDPSMRVDYGEE